MKLFLFLCIAASLYNIHLVSAYGVNGGIQCAACTIVTGVFGQVAEIHNEDIVNITQHICDHLFWSSAANACHEAVQTLEPLLYLLIKLEGITPDTFCYGLNFCHQDPGQEMCHLFPAPSKESVEADMKLIQNQAKPFLEKWYGSDIHKNHNICDLPGVKALCILLTTIFNGMTPAYDLDGDKFSSSEVWRGSHWRGRDCSDFNSKIYPGRLPLPYYADVNDDTNCNGIWGLDEESGIPWETKLCGSSKSRGIIMLGDSVGAHFHFPSLWFNPNLISKASFRINSTGVLLDELDWPQYSFSTGFKNITDTELIQGKVDSIYLRMRQRNLCNHRDYQNVCRNGATSFSLLENVKNIARGLSDKPVTVLLGVFGNDVCNRFPNTLSNMTSTKQFYKNIESVVNYLELSLPPQSHIALIGLVNGSFIHETLAERLHPIGQYNGNVKYKDVFKWFQCMQISPCNGWLHEDKYIRDQTTKRATELSHVMKYLAASFKSKKISLSYVPNPLSEVLKKWKNKGKIWQLFESIDGFHPNQVAQSLITEVLWKDMKFISPNSIGPTNPYNEEILKQFGDQGGH